MSLQAAWQWQAKLDQPKSKSNSTHIHHTILNSTFALLYQYLFINLVGINKVGAANENRFTIEW